MNVVNMQKQSTRESIPAHNEKTRLSGPWLLVARTVWVTLVALSLGLTIVSFPIYYQQLQRPCIDATTCNIVGAMTAKGLQALTDIGFSSSGYATFNTIFWALILAVWSGIGFLIFWRKSNNGVALLAAFSLVMFNTTGTAQPALTIAYPALALPIDLLGVIAQISLWLFFLLFPNGKLVPRWIGLLIPLYILQSILTVAPTTSLFNIINWPGWIHALLALSTDSGIIVAQIYRYRRVSTAVERQQTKWVAFAITTVVSGFLVFAVLFNVFFPVVDQSDSPYSLIQMVYPLLSLLIPSSIGIAILRYQLWDINLLIQRTLVYGILTACVIGIYVLIVGYLGALFHTGSNLVISLLATGFVAVLFQPLRERLQRVVNHLIYGERDEPYTVVTRLSQRLALALAPEAVLPTLVETVAQALKLPYAAILLKREQAFDVVASYGQQRENPLILPLIYQGETLGQLHLAPRTPGEVFSSADKRLLDELARQTGLAVHAVRLTSDLQHAREHLVTAREEERRRLRRDLHDGLGSALTSVMFKLDATDELLERDPAKARALLTDVRSQTQESITDIRHLVYNLRPPILDEWGLVAALREHVAQYALQNIQVSLDAPQSLPPLPAAVEVAMYRIVLEALANVSKHSQATHCTIHLALLANALTVEVQDNGIGRPAGTRAGVGLTAMHERAAELGGTCVVENVSPTGTRVYAYFPLERSNIT